MDVDHRSPDRIHSGSIPCEFCSQLYLETHYRLKWVMWPWWDWYFYTRYYAPRNLQGFYMEGIYVFLQNHSIMRNPLIRQTIVCFWMIRTELIRAWNLCMINPLLNLPLGSPWLVLTTGLLGFLFIALCVRVIFTFFRPASHSFHIVIHSFPKLATAIAFTLMSKVYRHWRH